jgi:hypothetical protein
MAQPAPDLGYGFWKWDATAARWKPDETRMYFGGRDPGFDPNNYPVVVQGKFDGQLMSFPLMATQGAITTGYCVCQYDPTTGTWFPVSGQNNCAPGYVCDCDAAAPAPEVITLGITKTVPCSLP